MTNHSLTEQNWRNDPWVESLASAFCLQRNKEDMKNFLRDIATLSELQALAERLEVAKHLAKKMSYRDVAKMTGASTTTVTRVAKYLTDGAGGYKKYLRLESKDTATFSSIEALKNRKPAHSTVTPKPEKTSILKKFLQ